MSRWVLKGLFYSFFQLCKCLGPIIQVSSDKGVNKCEIYKCNKHTCRILIILLGFPCSEYMHGNNLEIQKI